MKGLERVGLCAGCRWVRVIRNRRGSDFFLCRKGKEDPAYPRYPRLPVIECGGFEVPETEGTEEADPEKL